MFNTIAGKRIAVLGFAFKKDTNDTRESAAIDVCRALLAEHAQLAIYDPKVTAEEIYSQTRNARPASAAGTSSRRVVCEPDAYAATAGAHALAVLTEWDDVQALWISAASTRA